jgi:peptidase E
MSITVLLVMTIFGGLVGFYIGESAGANQMLQSLQASQMMQVQPVMKAAR